MMFTFSVKDVKIGILLIVWIVFALNVVRFFLGQLMRLFHLWLSPISVEKNVLSPL